MLGVMTPFLGKAKPTYQQVFNVLLLIEPFPVLFSVGAFRPANILSTIPGTDV